MDRVRPQPNRGDVWDADFDPVRGHEQAGRRPALIVSANTLNHGPADLVVVVPLTSRDKGIPSHVPISPPEGGLTTPSFAMCEQIRVFAIERLIRRRGSVAAPTLVDVGNWLRDLLDV